MKNTKLLVKTFLCCLLLLTGLSCHSDPKDEIKFVLDNYDQIRRDFDSNMRQMEKNNPGKVSFQQSLDAQRGSCDKVNKIDLSKTPQDFRTAFTKLISMDCRSLNNPADLVTYKDDPKIRAYNDAKSEVEEIAAKYGYTYKYSTSEK